MWTGGSLSSAATLRYMGRDVPACLTSAIITCPKRGEWLEKIPIDPTPGTAKKIRAELAVCGVVDTAVFPDLSALGSQLERNWREREKILARRLNQGNDIRSPRRCQGELNCAGHIASKLHRQAVDQHRGGRS